MRAYGGSSRVQGRTCVPEPPQAVQRDSHTWMGVRHRSTSGSHFCSCTTPRGGNRRAVGHRGQLSAGWSRWVLGCLPTLNCSGTHDPVPCNAARATSTGRTAHTAPNQSAQYLERQCVTILRQFVCLVGRPPPCRRTCGPRSGGRQRRAPLARAAGRRRTRRRRVRVLHPSPLPLLAPALVAAVAAAGGAAAASERCCPAATAAVPRRAAELPCVSVDRLDNCFGTRGAPDRRPQ